MPYREDPIDQARVDALRATQLSTELADVGDVAKLLQQDARDAAAVVGQIQAKIAALQSPRYGGLIGGLIGMMLFRPDQAAIGRETEELERARRALGFAKSLVDAASERKLALEAEIRQLAQPASKDAPDDRIAATAIAAGISAALGVARDVRGALRQLAAAAQAVQREEMAYALGSTDQPPRGLAVTEERQAHARSRLLLGRATMRGLGARGAAWATAFGEAIQHVEAAGAGPGAEWCDHLGRASKAIDAVTDDLETARPAATSGA